MSSCDNVGVAEHRVSWIQHNADCVLPKELLRVRTEEQSFQCGFHPRIFIVSNRAQQISPSLIFDDCFDHQLHSGHSLGVFSGRNCYVFHLCLTSFTFIFMQNIRALSMKTGHREEMQLS